MPRAKLYVIPGSHPSKCAELMLQHKGIDYKRVDLVPVIAKAVLRIVGFSHATVPALKIDGRKIQGSRTIAAELDKIQPETPLFPRDLAQKAKVIEAEQWGDEVLQTQARRTTWWILKKHPRAMVTFAEGAKLGVPVTLAQYTAPLVAWASARINKADDTHFQSDIAELGAHLEKIDGLIAEGVIGGDTPNAADYQIATGVRLLLCFDDFRPLLEQRPCGQLALRVVPDFPGSVPVAVPQQYLALL